ncbi:hypothetical protein [Streptomyces sp. NPDC091212]|uniref:hypothetical protein n=1 Tax=Streptomyces sp. NPDC091212 TaxID=3155191 RepID=UPI0034485BA4
MSDDTDENAQPIGPAIDALGITATLADGELVSGAIVLLKVIETDGSTRLSSSYSDGLGWIERAGMLRIAELMETGSVRARDPED